MVSKCYQAFGCGDCYQFVRIVNGTGPALHLHTALNFESDCIRLWYSAVTWQGTCPAVHLLKYPPVTTQIMALVFLDLHDVDSWDPNNVKNEKRGTGCSTDRQHTRETTVTAASMEGSRFGHRSDDPCICLSRLQAKRSYVYTYMHDSINTRVAADRRNIRCSVNAIRAPNFFM